MCKKTHIQNLAAARSRIRLFVACGVLAAGIALPVAADVVTFDNSDGQFTWMWWAYSQPTGNQLDPTLGPGEQDSADPALSYTYWIQDPITSLQIVPHFIMCGGNAAIARDTEPVYIENTHYEPYSIWMHLATTFNSGDSVGADANWQTEADTTWFAFFAGLNPMLGQIANVGVRVELADGPHYGFVRLAWRERLYMYEPVAWGYETEPNVPVAVCSADFNLDAKLDSQDFFDFLGAFFTSDPRADFDGTGSVDTQDFFAFLASFFIGC